MDFFINIFIWFMFVYGLIEFSKNIACFFSSKNKIKDNGIFLIVATKNAEKTIEGFIRDFILKGNNELENEKSNIIVTDLNSSDDTLAILEKMKKDYNINLKKWDKVKSELDEKNCEGDIRNLKPNYIEK